MLDTSSKLRRVNQMLEYYIVSSLNDYLRTSREDLLDRYSEFTSSEIDDALDMLIAAKTITSWSVKNGTTYYSL